MKLEHCVSPSAFLGYHRHFCPRSMTAPEPHPAEPKKRPINLLRGWPSPNVLPAEALKAAANKVLSDPDIFVPGSLHLWRSDEHFLFLLRLPIRSLTQADF